MIEPTLINLHPNEYSQEFHYYPFAVKLDRCVEIVILLMTCLIKFVFQIKQRNKSKRVQHGYKNKWIENINKPYIMRMSMYI